MNIPPIAVTMGDPAGVGGELTLTAWAARHRNGPSFFAVDDPSHLAAVAGQLGIEVPIIETDVAGAADAFAHGLPVIPQSLPVAAFPGKPDKAHAPAIISSIERAVRMAMSGAASAVVTNPVYKKSLYDFGFKFPGQTEFVGALAAPNARPIMLLAGPSLKVTPLTTHLPLRDAIERVTREAIVRLGKDFAAALAQDFGFDPPRLAVAGLNPHAGEEGKMGREDEDVIRPAVETLRAAGVFAVGPLSPDSMFHAEARATYDAALCMYHDQALIPLKTLDFYEGVNATLGLPVVRTSPDHGTAFDIAGLGKANPASFLAALDMAAAIARRRMG